ncbi:unnamed protein product [Euphydryas editha]|uniref:THAP-type domain-containing protein n=1 Tax=Euphydryas editha TaxID=104508 RepID=A0AAU9V9V2_EUPED|nr:unnamed protein product [Euphydryas editha]
MVHCCVIGCNSRSERKLENITFHSFTKDTTLRDSWITSTGRRNWTPGKNTRICSKHFTENCFKRTQRMTFLNASSVPTLFIHRFPIHSDGNPRVEISSTCVTTDPIMQHKSYVDKPSTSTKSIEMDIIKHPTHEAVTTPTMTPRKKKLIKKLNRQTILAESRKKKLAIVRSKCRRIEKKNAELSAIIEKLQSKNLINQETADFLSLIDHQKTDFLQSNKSKFSPEVRKFALNLHFISPRAYNFVRQSFNTCLPHARTLARWYETVDGEPGFCSESLAALKLLVKNAKSERKWICGLCFDEMAIRKSVQWNGRNYIGYVNYGSQLESDAIPIAKEALVFMLTSINGSWKLPVGYFLINGVTAEQKAALVKICIDLVSGCGLDIVAVTFDGCPANFSMAKLLGCDIESDIINPVFTHNGKKVAIFPDPSHMLKLVRNTLGDKTFLTSEKGQISWNYIQLLVELQENEGLHLANKVRGVHINYRKQVMKVRLASQLFSESVADAIESCCEDLRLEQFNKCDATVDFIRQFNALFDILNSRNLKSYGYKKPISLKNYEGVKEYLENAYSYIKSLKLGSDNILITNRKTGFLGFLICIKTILFLYEELVKTEKIDFLSSYKLSQDHLEIFFSAVRSKGGFNNNPTATQFKSAFKRLLVHGELKNLTTGNCVPLSDINILIHSRPEVAINNTTDRNRLIENDEEILQSLDNEVVVPKDHDYLADPTRLTEYAKQVIIYIAGFVVTKLETQLKCEQCLSTLRSPEKLNNTFLIRKDKGGLCHPSKHVVILCEIAEEVYRKNKMLKKKDLLHHLLQKCLKKCIGLRLFSADYHFADLTHYSLLLKAICKKYLNVRIHYATKLMINNDDNIRNMYTKLILFKGQ